MELERDDLAEVPVCNLHRPGPGPPARSSQGMAYDEMAGQMVMFGGKADPGGAIPAIIEEAGPILAPLGDTWTWTGSTQIWSKCDPCNPSPQKRSSPALAYHGQRRSIVMFGGVKGSDELSDTWFWRSGAWTKCNGASCNPQSLSR